jgi:hypothetical protein
MRKPRLIFILLFVAAMAAARNLPAQVALDGVLPDRFGRWNALSSPQNIKSDESRAQMFAEVGLRNWLTREYSDGSTKVAVALQQFRDPTGAYEAYTTEINPDMQPSTVGRPSAVDHDRLLLLLGNYILEVRPPQNPSTEELQQLAKIVKGHSDPTPLPPIRMYLPRGFTDGTQKYALGPNGFRSALESLRRSEYSALAEEVGFNSGAEAMLGEYQRGKDAAVLLLIEYPTPQLAEQHLRHLEQAFSESAKQAGTSIERKGSLLSLVLAPTSAAFAEHLRSTINFQTQVTWHEPTHTITDPPWATILGKIMISTILFMVVAVVLGAAFGGLRVLAKVFFPGKLFDRPSQMDVLQLGLSSKRIDSRDFY